ncbi:MAG: hypothetical protein CALGDGBN_02710 [Pseudomonadales bacterium]|nr:hypothetical protein [Pseudomonadales bacterium]
MQLVFEDGLPGGTAEGSAPVVVTGTITISDADGLEDIETITIAGVVFDVSAGMGELVGESVSTPYGRLAITSYENGVYGYEYTLLSTVDNDSQSGATDEGFIESIAVSVSDGIASASAAIDVTIDDSEPVILGVDDAVVVNAAGLAVTGTIDTTSVDGIAAFSLAPSLGLAPEGLVYALQPDGTLVATDGTGDVVFTVVVDAAGSYTFTLVKAFAEVMATSPDFNDLELVPGKPYESLATAIYESYDPATGAGIGDPVTSVVFSAGTQRLNPSRDGLGVGDNLVDDPKNATPEVLAMSFADALSGMTLNVGNLSTDDVLVWKVYRAGVLLDSGEISGSYVGSDGSIVTIANNESPEYWIDLSRNGLDPDLAFDRVELSATDDTSWKFLGFTVEKPISIVEIPLDFAVQGTDNDGDVTMNAGFLVDIVGAGNMLNDLEGNTVLEGDLGADVFRWSLADPGAEDTISEFDSRAASEGGDVLDLRDLLHLENQDNLSNFLHFEASEDGSGTVVRISTTGEFTGDAEHDAGVAYQTIELQSAGDLLAIGTDQQIIEHLINNGKLLTDG